MLHSSFILLYFISHKHYFIKYYQFLFTDDIFGIDEISLHEGEHTENVYAVGGEIIDGVSFIKLFLTYHSLFLSL